MNLKKQLELAASPDGPCTGMDDKGLAFYCADLALRKAFEVIRDAKLNPLQFRQKYGCDFLRDAIAKEREKL